MQFFLNGIDERRGRCRYAKVAKMASCKLHRHNLWGISGCIFNAMEVLLVIENNEFY